MNVYIYILASGILLSHNEYMTSDINGILCAVASICPGMFEIRQLPMFVYDVKVMFPNIHYFDCESECPLYELFRPLRP